MSLSFDAILNQIFQPYFYYSVLFLAVSFVCIKVFTHYCHFITPKTKSMLYLIPLAIPIVVMAVYLPSTTIASGVFQIKIESSPVTLSSIHHLTASPIRLAPPIVSSGDLLKAFPTTVFSVTGLLCIAGLLAADVFALSMLFADDRIARRILHVISLSKDDYPTLQAKVAQLSKKLRIASPKIGVVEDLRPNAFTIGYGNRSTVVFSIGLLNLLDDEEVAAVASHELAHLKNSDFFHKLLSSTLTVVSFFNPLSYLSSAAAQREREILADQQAVQVLDKPSALSSALAKICKALASMPKERMLVMLSSNLLVTSSVLHRLGILSTHPRLDKRLRNISAPHSPMHLSHRNVCLTVFLCLLLTGLAVTVTYGMVNLQSNYAASRQPHVLDANFNPTTNPGSMFVGNPVSGQFSVASGETGMVTKPGAGVVGSPVSSTDGVLPSTSGGNFSGAFLYPEGSPVFSVGGPVSVYP